MKTDLSRLIDACGGGSLGANPPREAVEAFLTSTGIRKYGDV